jgi:uncharacterized protein YkwD
VTNPGKPSLAKLLLLLLPVVTALLIACACSAAVADAAAGHRAHTACRGAHSSHVSRHGRCPRTRAVHRRRHAAAARGASARAGSRSGVAGKRVHHARARTVRQRSAPVIVSAPTAGASIASVLATPCQNTELMPEPGDLEAIRAATLCLVNQERARNGELPLQVDAELEQAAQSHSEAMVSEDYFAHVAPDGETPVDRVQATGYIPNPQVGYTIGENIAWGTLELATPSAIVAAWIASPEHLANILFGEYDDTAIGIVPAAPAALANGQAGAIYSQTFGVIVE